jgi:hypothetical protein
MNGFDNKLLRAQKPKNILFSPLFVKTAIKQYCAGSRKE